MNDHIVIGGDITLDSRISGDCSLTSMVNGQSSEFMPIYPQGYSGSLDITPGSQRQILPTGGLVMPDDLIVEPIPNNYGLITWNGSILTVS